MTVRPWVLALALIGCGEDSRFGLDLEGTGMLAALDDCDCSIWGADRGGFEVRVSCFDGDGVDELTVPVAHQRAFGEGVFGPAAGGSVSVRAEVVAHASRAVGSGQWHRDVTLVQVLAPDGGRIRGARLTCESTLVDAPGAILQMPEPDEPLDPDGLAPEPVFGERVATWSPMREPEIVMIPGHPDDADRGYVIAWLDAGIELDLTDAEPEYRAFVVGDDGAEPMAAPPTSIGRPVAAGVAWPGQPMIVGATGIAVRADDGTWRVVPAPLDPIRGLPLARVDASGPRAVAATDAGLALFDGTWETVLGVDPGVILGPWDEDGVRVVERPREERLCTREIAFVGRPALLPQVESDPAATCLDVRLTDVADQAINGTTSMFQLLVDTIHGRRIVLFDAAAEPAEGGEAGTGRLIRGPLVPIEHLEAAPGAGDVIDLAGGTGGDAGLDVSPIGVARGGLHVGWLNAEARLAVPESAVPFVPRALPVTTGSAARYRASADALIVARLHTRVARRWLYLERIDLPLTTRPESAVLFPTTCYEPEAGDVCEEPPPGVCVESCPRVAVCDDTSGVATCVTEDGVGPSDPTSPIVPPDPDDPPDPDEPLEPQGNFLAGHVSAVVGLLEVTLEPLDGGRVVALEPPPDYTFDTSPERRYRLTLGTSLDDRIAPRALELTTLGFAEDLGVAPVYLSQGIDLGPVTEGGAPSFVASPATGTMLVRRDRQWLLVGAAPDAAIGLAATPVASIANGWPEGLAASPRLVHDGTIALVPDGFLGLAAIDLATGARLGILSGVDVDVIEVAGVARAALVADLEGAARVYTIGAAGFTARGAAIADGRALMQAGQLGLSADGERVAGLTGPEGAVEVVTLATGAIERPPLVDELGFALPAVSGVRPGADGLVVFETPSGERLVATRTGESWTTMARVPAGATLALSSSAPGAVWLTAAGVHGAVPALTLGVGALAGPARQSGDTFVAPTADRLVVIDLSTGAITGLDGAWGDVTTGPGGSFLALERLASAQASGFRRVARGDASGATIDKQVYHVPAEPIRLFGDLDRALVAYPTYASTGACGAQCVASELVPIVADASAGGVAFTLAAGLDGPFVGWGAPCALYRRADPGPRLSSDAAGPDALFCAR
ncbi:MAG: hypothetical protein IT385_19150 [Deltaproteobacteria bacterium]|nr:hypothetical protein [Deltaproteobacteria bacterium]